VIIATPAKDCAIIAEGEVTGVAGQEVAFATESGTVSVGVMGGRFHDLPSGMVEVTGGARRPLLGSPHDVRVPSVLLSYGESVALDAVAWTPVAGARSYRVELRDEVSLRPLARAVTTEANVPAGFAVLAPGAYSLRVAAVDEAGLEGREPDLRQLRVLGVGLPVGAYVDANHAVHFPPSSALQLSHGEGVEVGFGHVGAFTAAPKSLELFRNEPRLVRFKAKGAAEAEAVELMLLPRTAKASVEFGPRAPRWPGEPLQINVHVESQGEASSWLEAEPQVTVGVDPVDVAFTRDGDWLRGTLPARDDAGPWVVRVEVKDQHGIALGRDFVEIAARTPGAATSAP
jgi:hypothetical protein